MKHRKTISLLDRALELSLFDLGLFPRKGKTLGFSRSTALSVAEHDNVMVTDHEQERAVSFSFVHTSSEIPASFRFGG